MRIKFLKKILWFLNTLLVAGIVLYALLFFILPGARGQAPRTPEAILGRRNLPQANPDVKPKSVDPASKYRFTHELAISGDPPVEEVVEAPGPDKENIPPLKQNYELLWTKVDLGEPLLSYAHLLRKGAKDSDDVLTGQKVEGVWKLTFVEDDRAHFRRDGEDEDVVLDVVRPERAPLNGGGGGSGGSASGIEKVNPEAKPPREGPTREAVEVRPGSHIWEVPPEEGRWWGAWGEEEVQNVAAQTWTDPVTKKPAGIEIRELAEKSIIRRRGVETGDVIKAINGVPVHSKAEAIAWVKGPGKGLTRYVVTILRKGREFNLTYNVRKGSR